MEYKQILVSVENYEKLKELGRAGDSFNDVLDIILAKMNSLQQSNGVPAPTIVVNAEQTYTNMEDCQ